MLIARSIGIAEANVTNAPKAPLDSGCGVAGAVLGHRRPSGFVQVAGPSRVRVKDKDLVAGAARTTTGDIAAHEINHDASQFHKKWPVAKDGRLAIPAATREVIPD